jgi:hypothetical protein
MQEPALVNNETESGSLESQAGSGVAERIIAVWALSEAALGGVLHALRLPFTGLFVGGLAVVFITLIARFDTREYALLRAMIIVMIVKLIVSPHAPINAYLAIAFQGLAGALLFRFTGSFRTAALLLGILSLLQSSLQKLIIITLVFGMNFWKATDLFIDYVFGQMPLIGGVTDQVSIIGLVTGMYISIHLAFGLTVGIWAPIVAAKLSQAIEEGKRIHIVPEELEKAMPVRRKKRSRVFKRLTYFLILIISFSIFFLSYVVPVFEHSRGMAALIMVLRSIIIILVWYYLLGPFLMDRLRRFLQKKESRYKNEVANILDLLPVLRAIIIRNWKQAAPLKNPRRLPNFIQTVLVHILTVEL